MQVEHLTHVRLSINEETSKNLCKEIDEKVDAYANGDLGYAAEVMSLLWGASRKSGRLPPDFPRISTPPMWSWFRRSLSFDAPTPTNREYVKIALIRSIREGVFVDRKYWARHSRSGKILRPVYLSSIMTGQKLTYVDNRK